MSRFTDFRNPLSPVEMEIAHLGKEEQIRNATTPQYILGDGSVSFTPPKSNFFTNILQKSARNSIDLGTGAGAALNSGAGIVSRQFYRLDDGPIPLYQNEGTAVLSDGSVKPVDKLSGVDFFKAIDPTIRTILETNGYTETNFKGVKTVEEASERYAEINRAIFLDQSLRRYNEVNPYWASVTGILNFGLDVVTDPVNLVTFGIGGLAKSTLTTTAKVAAKEAGEAVLERSMVRIGRSMVDGDDFATAASKNPTDAAYVGAHVVDSTQSGGYVTREVIDNDGASYMVTSRIVQQDGDRVVYEPVRVVPTKDKVDDFVSKKKTKEGRNEDGVITSEPDVIDDPARLLPEPREMEPVTVRGDKRTGLNARLEDAYFERARLEKQLAEFIDEDTVEIGLDAGLDRLGKDIDTIRNLEIKINAIGRTIQSLEKRTGKELSEAYARRTALDKEFEEFLQEGNDFVEVSLETGLAYLKQDSDYLKALDRKYAGVNKTIARLEGTPNPTPKIPDAVEVPKGFKQPGESIKAYNKRRQSLAVRYHDNKIAKHDPRIKPEQEAGLVLYTQEQGLIKYDPSIVADGIPKDVADRVIIASAGPLSRGTAVGVAVAGGLAFDGASQYAEYIHRTQNLGYEEEFEYNYLRGGMSMLVTGGLAALASMPRGIRPKGITNQDIINHSPASLIGVRTLNKTRNGTVSASARADLVEVDALTRAEKWVMAAYNNKQAAEIMELLTLGEFSTKAGQQGRVSFSEIGTFFSKAPTFDEAKAFLMNKSSGDTDTAFHVLMKEQRDLQKDLILAKQAGDTDLTKKLQKQLRVLENKRRGLTSLFEFREGTEGYKYKAIIDDVPATDIYNPIEDRLFRLRNLLALRKEDLPESTQGNIDKITSRIFDFLARLGSQGVAARDYQKMAKLGDNPIAQHVARMIGAIDSRIANDFYTTPDGMAVRTVEQNIALFSLKRSNFVNIYYRVMKNKTREQREAIGREVMQARTGTKETNEISQEARELLPSFSKYYDDMANIGTANGSIRNRIDNYVNIRLKPDLTNETIKDISNKLAKFWKDRRYSDPHHKAHIGTLIKIKVLDTDGKIIDRERYPKRNSARFFEDLTPDDQQRYLDNLDATLREEAEFAVQRRLGRDKGNPEDPVVRDEGRQVQYRTDNRASRVIEQEFWVQDDMIQYLDTELSETMKSYESSMGTYIARQETMTDIFGEPVRFDDVISVLRSEANKMDNTSDIKQDILDAIEALEGMGQRVTGYRSRKATGLQKIFQPVLDIASGVIRQGVVIPMTTEVSVVGFSSIFRPSEARLMVQHLAETFKFTRVREDLMALGHALDYERAKDRFFGHSPYDPANAIGRGARWFKEKSTIWFGEEGLTNRLRRFSTSAFYMRTGRKLMSVADKLENLDIKIDPQDVGSLSAAARKAGFGGDAAFARDVRRVGLATPRARKAIKRFKEIDKESLNHPDNARQIAMKETDPELREAMLEVAESVGILARERTDRFVVKRSSGTEFRDNDELGAALLQFLTYPTSWFNAYLKRGSQGPNHQLAGYMVAYLLGEVTASIIRDVVYKGKTPEEILEEWDQDFYKKMGTIAQRIPIAGPWSDFVVAPITSMVTGGPTRFSIGSTAAGSFAERSVSGTISVLRKWINGEPVDPQQLKNATRMLPFLGTPPAQMAGEELLSD